MHLRDPGYKLVDQLEYKLICDESDIMVQSARHQFPNGYWADVTVYSSNRDDRLFHSMHKEYKITALTATGAELPHGSELSGPQLVCFVHAANLILRDIAELE